ncbi:MAG: hypothetical protein QGG40_19760, partial [Myxococcota bacterium]|nr:hypothetical protein [Myxococcota bacterium]
MPTTSQRQSTGESTTATSGSQALVAADVAALVGNIVVTELVEAANASDEASLLQSLEELTHEQGIREDASGLSEIITELVLGLEQGLLTPADVGVDAVRSEGLAMLREVADLLGQAESDESSLWDDWLGNSDESWWENESQDATLVTLAQSLLPTKASGTTEIDLKSGTTYTVTDGDLQGGDEAAAWKAIARQHGMHEDTLIAFNQHVATVQVDEHAVAQPVTPTLTAGTDLYLPSAQEQLLFQCRDKAGSYEGGVALYAEVAGLESNIALLETARERSSGDIGEGYGIPGLDGKFLTENPDLAGASELRTTKINGKKQYKVNWGSEFWKCSLFLHDVIFSAGLEPHMTENQHYLLAG